MKRIPYLDVSKGLTILFVILGHTLPPSILRTLIYSFHMPLFFFLSGYFFRPISFPSLIRKKSRQLLHPYYFTCAALVILSALMLFVKGRAYEIPANTQKLLFAGLYASGLDQNRSFFIPQIGAIWFLWALFFALLLLNFLLRLKHSLTLLASSVVLGFFTGRFFWLPLSIQPAMTSILYLFLGYQSRKYKLVERLKNQTVYIWLITLLWLLCAVPGGEIVLAGNEFPHPFLNLISSVSGIFTFLMTAFFLYRRTRFLSSYLQWMGTETLLILCVHLLELRLFPWYLVRSFLAEYLCFSGWRIYTAVALLKISIATAAVALKKYFFKTSKKER